MADSELTRVLAIVGAVSGAGGVLLNLLNYRRNRPRLAIKSVTEFTSDKKAFVRLEVRNEGLQPVQILGIGVAISSLSGTPMQPLLVRTILYPIDLVRRRRARVHEVKYNELAEEDGEEPEVLLLAGKRKVIKVPMETVASRVGGSQNAWPYVEDISEKSVYGPQPILVQSTAREA
jgi:hypothetical protein